MNILFFSQFFWLWWAQVESNHRPHAYQACALTFWAMSPCYLHISGIHLWSLVLFLLNFTFGFFNRWWRWRDSNPWPPACRAGALPTELHPQMGFQLSLKIEQQHLCRTLFFVVCLFLCELRVILFQSLMFSIERRWSSRTFRYGYLVTT